jgi:hypothetical protein
MTRRNNIFPSCETGVLSADTSTIIAGATADSACKGGGVYMRTYPGIAPQYLGPRGPSNRHGAAISVKVYASPALQAKPTMSAGLRPE